MSWLLDMLPSEPSKHASDGVLTNVKPLHEFHDGFFALPHVSNLVGIEPRKMLTLAPWLIIPFLVVHVGHVLLNRAEKQMIRVNARWHVTRMAYAHAIWNAVHPEVKKPRHSVRAVQPCVERDMAVAARIGRTFPDDAACRRQEVGSPKQRFKDLFLGFCDATARHDVSTVTSDVLPVSTAVAVRRLQTLVPAVRF